MQYRTDLAMERAADHPDIPGVQVINTQAGDYARCEVRIESEEAAPAAKALRALYHL